MKAGPGMMRPMSRPLTGALLALALLAPLATSSGASAQDAEEEFGTLPLVATVALGLADVGFLAGDLYFGSEGDWVPPYVAWTQLILMTPANIVMGILTLEHSTEGAWLALGIGELVVGTWFAVHGTLSLMGQPEERPPDPPATTAGVAPLPEGGAMATLRTLF